MCKVTTHFLHKLSRKIVDRMTTLEVSIDELERRITAILTGIGLTAEDARCVVDSLLDAEMSGVESHGLMRLGAYVDRVVQGTACASPDIQVTKAGAVAQIDGGNGLGQVVMKEAVAVCVQLAKEHGVGVVSVSHSNHFGTAAYYSRKLAEQGCLGFVASSAGPTMAPFGGMDLLLGTNPFSIAFPGKDMVFCADMASSAAAKGKIRSYAQKGLPIPRGWALDAQGNDTVDAVEAVKGILLPMGGHKGYALAMAVDALCGLLSGAALSGESASMFQGAQAANTGHFVAALNIAHFLPPEEFSQRAQHWFDQIHNSKPRPGFEHILIPGEPEEQARRTCGATIRISEKTAAMLDRCIQEYTNEKECLL